MTQPKLPSSASRAVSGEDGRLYAPAAQRNADVILSALTDHAPRTGAALELASGSGEHAVRFAEALPDLTWHPSDVDAARLASIEAWRRHAGHDNLAPALALDATAPGWAAAQSGYALVLVVNLLHLISRSQTATLVSEVYQALNAGGRLMIYGPFLRDGVATSAGDRTFDAQLREANPEIGYKNDVEMERLFRETGFDRVERLEMPANNLFFVAEKA